MLGWTAAGVPCSPFRSATPHSTTSRARRFPLQMIFNCSIFDGNHCSNLDGSGQTTVDNREFIDYITPPWYDYSVDSPICGINNSVDDNEGYLFVVTFYKQYLDTYCNLSFPEKG